MSDREDMATSFGAAAGSYQTGRPSYPAESVAWLLDGLPDLAVIADVGAGTGKLTKALLGPQRTVVAVDPDPDMLAALRDAVPGVDTFVGTAEELPFENGSVDAVVLGQAWHWVNPTAGSAEAGRVLRAEGLLGLIWNIRNDSTAWVAEMSRIMHHSAAERLILHDGGPSVDVPFGEPDVHTFAWSRSLTREVLIDMVRSRSYYITADEPTQSTIESELDELFDSLPELAHGGTIELPYTTYTFAYRAV